MKEAEAAYKQALQFLDKAKKLDKDKKLLVQKDIMQALNFFKNAPASMRNEPELDVHPK